MYQHLLRHHYQQLPHPLMAHCFAATSWQRRNHRRHQQHHLRCLRCVLLQQRLRTLLQMLHTRYMQAEVVA